MPHKLNPLDPTRLGPYEVVARLGQGGMGIVFLGRDGAGRSVAIKVLRNEFSYDDEYRRRFRSEVNRAREVPPFCTAELIDANLDHDPPYLVIEYVDGPSLAAVIEQRGPLRGAELQSVAVGMATALTAIHGAGVIHRDLKPGNVLFAFGGVKVIDFGIARPTEITSQHTGTGQLVGTVAYMAPERFGPAVERTDEAAADIFAWGAVVTFAATGRTPFAADSPPATAMRILTQLPDLTGLDEPLHSLVARALEKEPRRRPSARELLDVLLASERPAEPALAPSGSPVVEPRAASGASFADQSGRERVGFRTFVAEHQSALRDLAYLICGDWRMAEDVVTDALASSYPRWHRLLRPDLQVKTTVVRAATKASTRRRAAVTTGSDSPAGADRGSRLREAMLLITPGQRAALGLAFAMRMSPDEIADVLGCSAQQIDAQVAEGLSRLRNVLGELPAGYVAPLRGGT